MKQPFSFIILLIYGILRGINYLVAQVSVPLSMIPFLVGVFFIWIIQTIAKIFMPNLEIVDLYTNDYHEMIQDIKKKRYDELYSEMKKREDQNKGAVARTFDGSEHHAEVEKLNKQTIENNTGNKESESKPQVDTVSVDTTNLKGNGSADFSADKILKDLGIDSKTRDSLDAKTARLQKELADIKAKKKSNNMPIQTNNNPLNNYKNVSDQAKDVKNFRLYFKDKPTNLVWYGGKIIYVPKDYFLMQNLVNIHHATGRKCILYKPEVNLIDEMSEKNIIFTLAEDIEELMNRLNASGLNKTMLLSDELGVETTSDVDYSEFDESIYDEDGSWNIKS